MSEYMTADIIIAWIVYGIWMLMIIIGIAYFILKAHKKQLSTTLLFLSAAHMIPVTTAINFTYVFILNKGSSVAQLAERDLWSFWFQWWPPLFIGTLISITIILISLFCPPYPPKTWKTFALKILTLLTLAMTFFHLAQSMPDA